MDRRRRFHRVRKPFVGYVHVLQPNKNKTAFCVLADDALDLLHEMKEAAEEASYRFEQQVGFRVPTRSEYTELQDELIAINTTINSIHKLCPNLPD